MNKLLHVFHTFGLIRAKNKKRKKTGYGMFNPNKTFYMTFLLSILFHLGLIYSIPAVNLFSESPAGLAMEETIVVDLLEVEHTGHEADVAPMTEDNQFQVPAPEPPPAPPQDTEADTPPAPEPEPLQGDIAMRFPVADDQAEALLLNQGTEPQPEIESLRKRAPKHTSPAIRRRETRLQQDEKVSAKPLPAPTQRHIQQDEHEKAAMTPFQTRDVQLPQEAEHRPIFPLQPESRKTDTPDPAEQPLRLAKRRPNPADREDIPFNPAIDGKALVSSKRRIGMDREDAADQNRFGIFAGHEFDDMRLKQDMQKTIFEEETKEDAPLLPEESEQTARSLPADMDIEGPVKGRKILRRPAPPKVDITRGVDLQLKFWVLPDGTIGEVIPLKRGDAHLERIAINYLKQWQFEPLPPGADQQKIWGTIPIRFIVQ